MLSQIKWKLLYISNFSKFLNLLRRVGCFWNWKNHWTRNIVTDTSVFKRSCYYNRNTSIWVFSLYYYRHSPECHCLFFVSNYADYKDRFLFATIPTKDTLQFSSLVLVFSSHLFHLQPGITHDRIRNSFMPTPGWMDPHSPGDASVRPGPGIRAGCPTERHQVATVRSSSSHHQVAALWLQAHDEGQQVHGTTRQVGISHFFIHHKLTLDCYIST